MKLAIPVAAAVMLVACGGASSPAPRSTPTPTPTPRFSVGDKVSIHGHAYRINAPSPKAVNMAAVCERTEIDAPAEKICSQMRRWITDEMSQRSCKWADVKGNAEDELGERWYYVAGCELDRFAAVYDALLVREADLKARQ